MKAYVVTADHAEASALVYAMDPNQARKTANGSCWGLQDFEYIELRATREPRADCWAQKHTKPYLDDNGDHMRELGWYCLDGGACCDCCGLYDFSDGHDDSQAICIYCGNCGDCGHDKSCVYTLADTLFPDPHWVDVEGYADIVSFKPYVYPMRYWSPPRLMVEADL